MPNNLPKGWVRTTLGEVCHINPGLRWNEPLADGTEVSFVPMAAVEEETGRLDASQIRTLGSVRRGYTPFSDNDVIFSKITPCMENGKIALATGLKNGLGFGSTEFFVFRPHSGVLPRFVLHFLLQPSLRKSAERQMTGASGQKRVPLKFLSAYPFLLPPTREQGRIVAKLDASLLKLERAGVAAQRAQRRLCDYRDAVLGAAVTGQLTHDWRESQVGQRTTAEETREGLLQQILRARRSRWEEAEITRLHDGRKSHYTEPRPPSIKGLPPLPSSWVWASLGQVSTRVTVGHVGSMKTEYASKGVPFLRSQNVRPNRFEPKGLVFIQRQFHAKLAKSRITPGDVVVVRSGVGVGTACVIPGSLGEANCSDLVLIQRPLIQPKFISFYMNSAAKRLVEVGKVGVAQPHFNTASVASLPIPLPPIAEQAEIVRQVESRLAAADRLATSLQRQVAKAQEVRDSLLREAFAGQLVPRSPDDEPGSALLDRIRMDAARASVEQTRRRVAAPTNERSDFMQEKPPPSIESLRAAWKRIGRKADAQRLFNEAGFGPDYVIQFYESLRAVPEVRTAFRDAVQGLKSQRKPVRHAIEEHEQATGRFRLVRLWLEDFKNLRDYNVWFDPAQGLDVVLGWNGTGKSNLFEALVIIFRDLHDWWEKNHWPDKPMNGFVLSYEMDDHSVEVVWRPGDMKRPELKRGPIGRQPDSTPKLEPIKREQLPLPRFVFGYYSGPTNRLAEHFLPMKQAHYVRLREAKSDDARTLAKLLEQRRFFCAETHHAKYVLLAFSYREDPRIKEFLEHRLRIVGFESALFVIRKPRWARPGSEAADFWGATGIMRRVMERLRRFAIAPMVLKQNVSDGYRSVTEDHYYFFLPNIESLQAFAAEYQNARTFFLALESTDFSELIYDVKIQVRVKSTATEQVSITFHQLSEGEQQLLMVLGLLRFTKSRQSLVLLDEPDTHLNPHWSVEYLKDLGRVMSDGAIESSEQQTSQILMATHDPLVIASLIKEQIHLLKRDWETGACKWVPATVNPRGLGFTGILVSEMFGFRSDLDEETLADLDNRVRLIAKDELTGDEKKELETIDKRLAEAGFSKAFSDPYYAAFVRAWGRRHSQLMAGQQILSKEQLQEVDRVAAEVLKEAVAEVEKEVK